MPGVALFSRRSEAFRQPGSILQGRILRLGATVNW
jgi:hypothetical protein